MMVIFYILLTINLFFLVIAFINLFFAPRISAHQMERAGCPLVSVLIPARNEAENIAFLLEDLCKQHYSTLEILVYDDLSEDATAQIVRGFERLDSRIRLIEGSELKSGWSGKQYGCHQLALQAQGSYFLFLDADVRIMPELVDSVVLNMEKFDLDLMSAFPTQVMQSEGEKIVVPIMMTILLTLLPLSLVAENNHSSLAAANGQMMCFNRSCYKRNLFHELFKASRVEDISIIRYMKEKEMRVACYLGAKLISCRMYRNYRDAIKGFSKNLIHFFGGSYTASFIYWLIFYASPFSLLLIGQFFLFFVLFSIQLIALILVAVCCNNKVADYLLWFPIRIFSFLQIWGRSLKRRKDRKEEWKGRMI